LRIIFKSFLLSSTLFIWGALNAVPQLFPKSQSVSEHLNLSYGPYPKQVLDVVSSEKCKNSPVIIFAHGGSWRWGQKDYHRTIGQQFARSGIVFTTIDYRLYPDVRFPSFPQDVALSVQWVRENISKYGGDRNRIFLMGHSAGAHSVSLVGLDPKYLQELGGGLDWIKGVIPMACPFEFDPSKEFLYRDLFPRDLDVTKLMPMGIPLEGNIPSFFIMQGGLDPIIRNDSTLEFARKVEKAGGRAQVKLYRTHGHFSLVRRTTSWHIWPSPLLKDVVSFIESESEVKLKN
jgi:acetyl esterase/lipase